MDGYIERISAEIADITICCIAPHGFKTNILQGLAGKD